MGLGRPSRMDSWVRGIVNTSLVLGFGLAACGAQRGELGESAAKAERSEPGPVTKTPTATTRPEPVQLSVEVLRELPHSSSSYTQGLLFVDGRVFESRGQNGHSGIDVWDPESGVIERSIDLEREFFGEGIARVGDVLWQLTWHSGLAFRWSIDGLENLGEASFTGQGWGLEFDGERLILSDGTHELRFYDPETFELLGKLPVLRGSRPQDDLNELEYYAQGKALFANVYQTDEIVRIDLRTGQVTGVADLSGLLTPAEARRAEVLNGIAYWPERDSFLITGKHWPKSFEVRFSEETE